MRNSFSRKYSLKQEETKKRSNGEKRNFIRKQNTHHLLVGTLSIGIPSNKLKKRNLINENALNREPVPLKFPCVPCHAFVYFWWQPFVLLTCRLYINWAHSIMAALIIITVLQNWCLAFEHLFVSAGVGLIFSLCPGEYSECAIIFDRPYLGVSPMYFDILLPGSYVVFCYMARHLVFSGFRLFVNIMCAWLSYITDC